MANLSSLNFRLTANIAPFRKGLNKAERSMDRLGRKMQQTGKNMSMKLTAPIAALGAMSFNVFRDFELEMAKVKAVSGATADEFKLLSDNAKELGRSTVFSAREVAGLQLEFAKLGFTAKQIEGVTEATLNLAQASGSDLARSAEVAGATLRGFGLDVNQTTRVTDVMAKSFASSALDIESFAEGMKNVAPTAKSAGISLEQTTAMMAILANAGVKGSKAGTQLRRIISEIETSGKSTSTALKDLSEKGLDLGGAMDEVGRQAQTALITLVDNIDGISKLDEEFANASGSAKEMADIMDMTSAGASKALGSAVEGLAIEFGGLISVALTPVIKKLTQFATFVNNLPDGLKRFIAIVAGLAAAIGPLVFVAGSLVRVMTALRAATILQTIATGALGVAVQLATSPITLIMIAIFALAAAFIYVRENSEAFSTGLRNAFRDVANFVLPLVNTMIKAFNKIAQVLGKDSVLIEPFEKFQREEQPILKSFKEVFGGVARSLGLVKEEAEETTEELGKLPPVVDEINKSTAGATFGLKRTAQAFMDLPRKAKPALMELKPLMVAMKKEMVDFGALAISAGKAVQNQFARSLENAFGVLEEGETRFGKFKESMISGLRSLITQFIAAAIAAFALAVAVRLAFGGVAGLGGIGDIFGTMQSVAGFMPNIPMLAEGGVVTSPTLAMIGEGGQSEAVIPLDRLNEFGGGSQRVEVVGRISGSDILLSQERASRNRTRQRGF
jgi:phage-related minor tail protein